MSRQDAHEELRARLHEAAEAHEPDRARMLARIERGMSEHHSPGPAEDRPPVWSWARVAGATAAVAGMLTVGGYAVASAVKDAAPPQRQQTVAVSPTPTPSRDPMGRAPAPPVDPAPASDRPPKAHRDKASGAPSGASTAPAVPSAGAERDGPLRSQGSVDRHSNEFWAQSNLTLKTSGQLTSLTVQLRVAQTGGVGSTGAWHSLPEQDFDLTIAERNGFLVYTWVLEDGRTVPPGEWVFAGQYNHERGHRDAQDDRYTVRGTAGGHRRSVGGGFAAHTAAEGDS